MPDNGIKARRRDPATYRTYRRAQERISRRKILSTTAVYLPYFLIVMGMAVYSGYVLRAIAFVPVGAALWMAFEYYSHRYVLHAHFAVSHVWYKFPYTWLANKFLDPMHFQHHERPFDGNHTSGRLRDMLMLFIPFAPLSWWLFPPYTASVVAATFFFGYIFEEWVHHTTHYYTFKNPYLRYMRKHHMYHHTKKGMKGGFGTSSGVLDYLAGTRYPEPIREKLYGNKKNGIAAPQAEVEV